MHKESEAIEHAVGIPLLHIADATAAAIRRAGQKRAGLLGTRFTMEDPFYSSRTREKFKIETVVPSPTSRQLVHDVIYGGLCHGVVRSESRKEFQNIICELAAAGADAVILACTEIEMLVSPADSDLPAYASTTLHALAAVDFALQTQTVAAFASFGPI
jgi:aspartate racemase